MKMFTLSIIYCFVWIGTLITFANAGVLFEVTFGKNDPSTFVIKLDNLAKIQEARKILHTGEKRTISGKIRTAKADYNTKWTYHLEPSTISFDGAIEASCDTSPRYIYDHLHEVGSTLLPNNIWCPRHAKLNREIIIRDEDEYEDL